MKLEIDLVSKSYEKCSWIETVIHHFLVTTWCTNQCKSSWSPPYSVFFTLCHWGFYCFFAANAFTSSQAYSLVLRYIVWSFYGGICHWRDLPFYCKLFHMPTVERLGKLIAVKAIPKAHSWVSLFSTPHLLFFFWCTWCHCIKPPRRPKEKRERCQQRVRRNLLASPCFQLVKIALL